MKLFILYKGCHSYDGGHTVLDIYRNESDAIAMMMQLAALMGYIRVDVTDLPSSGGCHYQDDEENPESWLHVEAMETGLDVGYLAQCLTK